MCNLTGRFDWAGSGAGLNGIDEQCGVIEGKSVMLHSPVYSYDKLRWSVSRVRLLVVS